MIDKATPLPYSPGGYVIQLDRGLSREQLDEIAASWRHKYPDVRLIVLPPGMTIRALTWRERTTLAIARWRRARG